MVSTRRRRRMEKPPKGNAGDEAGSDSLPPLAAPPLTRVASDASASMTLSTPLVSDTQAGQPTVQVVPFPSYRVDRVEVHMGQGLERIKFTYTDGTSWNSGSSGGKPSAPLILLPREFLVKVVHERFLNQRSAGAAVKFTTNLGRQFDFTRAYLASGLPAEETTVEARPGHEIVSLVIRRGLLQGTVQQRVPEGEEGEEAPAEWYATVLPSSEEGAEGGLEVQYHTSWTSAKAGWAEAQDRVNAGALPSALLVDVKARAVSRSVGSKDDVKALRTLAVNGGLAKDFDTDGRADAWDSAIMLWRLLCHSRTATALFLVKTLFLIGGSWFTLKSHVQGGRVVQAVTSQSVNATFIQGNWAAEAACDWLLGDCEENSMSVRYSLVASFVVFAVLGKALSISRGLLAVFTTNRTTADLEVSLFRRVLNMDMAFFELHSEVEIRTMLQVERVQHILDSTLPNLFQQAARVIMALWLLTGASPMVTGIFVAFAFAARFVRDYGVKTVKRYQRVADKAQHLRQQVRRESFAEIGTMKMLAKEEHHSSMFEAATMRHLNAARSIVFVERLVSHGGSLLTDTFSTAVVYCTTIAIFHGSTAGGVDLVAFLALVKAAASSLSGMKWSLTTLSISLPVVERFWAAQELTPAVVSGSQRPPQVRGAFHFKDVRFAYPTRPDEEALQGLSLTIAANKMTAIVGDSGAGKSTITKLLLRLYDPTGGSITLDGVDLTQWDTTYLRQNIAVVNQNPSLMEASLGENIAYGAVGSEYDPVAVQAAAEAAQCDEFITRLRGGFDTFAGTGGSQISGGQKQRIAIARAMMRDPAVLILDEATSALDAANERLVQTALETAMVGRTIVVVAHRLSTVRNADVILCMKQGVVVEQGTHEELLAAGGAYSELVANQLSE